ncbi:MAG: hypothetical protein H0X17_01655 [Deltaproteobacteria bacterium]|nr:hypothetical protein [Deltaproteobacteria bacterium]
MRLLAIKVLALVSATGGPLYLYDQLQRGPQDWRIFAFCFSPIAMMLFGSLSFGDPPGAKTARAAVRLGMFGAIALAMMNAYTAYRFVTGPLPKSFLLILAGVAVGFVASGLYLELARRFLGRPRHGDLSGNGSGE